MGSCYIMQGEWPATLCWPGWVAGGGREAHLGGGVCIYIVMADSHCCMAETNTAL